jgi:hypothetical protein
MRDRRRDRPSRLLALRLWNLRLLALQLRAFRRLCHRSKFGQTAFQEVIRLRIHRKRMDLPRGRQAAHRFPYPRTRRHRGEKDLDLFARSGVDRLQVHGHQQRKRGHLRGAGGRRERVPVPHAQQLPLRRLTHVPVHRADAQRLPQLRQATQNRGLRQFAPQRLPGLGSTDDTFFVQRFPQLEHQGRDLVARGLLRRMLPIRVRAQAKNVGQCLGVGQKIRLLAHCPEQVQSDHATGCYQAGQQSLCLFDSRRAGRGLGCAHAGFDKGGRRRRQLRTTR